MMNYSKRIHTLIIASVTCVATLYPSATSFAISAEQRRVIDSGALFFNVEESPICQSGVLLNTGDVSTTISSNVPDPHKSILVSAAAAYSVNPNLLAALYLTEQGNRWKPIEGPYNSSNVGASGPFQFMPRTWEAYGVDVNGDNYADVQDFTEAAHGAAKMASSNGITASTPIGAPLQPFLPGTILHFAIAYNWGSGNMSRVDKNAPPSSAPDETRRYIDNIRALMTSNLSRGGKGDYGKFAQYPDPTTGGVDTPTGREPPQIGGGCENNQNGTGDGTIPTSPPTVTCEGKKEVSVNPSSNLNGLVNEAGNETACFRLANGNYSFGNIRPKTGQTFLGESPAGVVVNGNGFENAFHGTADSVSISNFTLFNFNDNGGTKPQEQAPIRGTDQIWSSHKASRWIVENMIIHSNLAAGVFMGDGFTVRSSVIYDNGVTGIGGDSIIGGLIEGNKVYRNGANAARGAEQNGAGIKLTQVDGRTSRVVIRGGNEVHDNEIGIWCDVDCDGVTIEGNKVWNHKTTGIFYEISKNAIIRDNTVTDSSTWSAWLGGWNNGSIGVGESQNVLIEGNTINGGVSAITVRGTYRPAPGETYLQNNNPNRDTRTSNVTVRNNTINGSKSIGASHETVASAKIDYNSITFSGNTYSNPSEMTFWWSRSGLTFVEWQAAGRDRNRTL